MLLYKVTKEINNAKSTYIKEYISSHQSDPKSISNILKELSRNKTNASVDRIVINDQPITDLNVISDVFNKHFSTIASKRQENSTQDMNYLSNQNQIITSYVSSKVPQHIFFSIPPINECFVAKTITSFSDSKDTGLDDISIKLLKLAGKSIHRSIRNSNMLN